MKNIYTKITFHIRYILKNQNPAKIIWAYFLLLTKINNLVIIKKSHYKLYFSKNVLALNNYLDKTSRNIEERLIINLLQENSIYIDIGANIGTTSLAANAVFKEISIHSFEANPTTFKILQSNIRLNKAENIITYSLALGSVNGFVKFENKGTDDQNSVSNDNDTNNTIKVEIKKLDDLIKHTEIRLIKIDFEGFE